ncbi:MAG: two-component system response regulator [Oleiphilus sp.]|nr:MAG: two-component system response regulator [Oleiphilus sp.]
MAKDIKVLVADDQPEIRSLICLILETFFNVKPLQAVDGQNGLDILSMQPDIDLIITDLDMPGVNGLEMVRAIHAQEAFANTPIIMVTSEGQDLQQAALDAGVSEYFDKPVNPDLLTPSIRKYLDSAQANLPH